MSLDGRIAASGDDLGWLLALGMPEEMKTDYDAFYDGIDGLVMGRRTYDWIVANHEWAYSGKTAYVVTNRPLDTERGDVVAVSPDYPALRRRIEQAGHGTIWILGGGIVQRSALDAGMFDHVRVFIMPIIVGSGPLVFADGAMRRLELTGSRVWPGGSVELAYSFGEEK
jgi:dihydrofolate reductase